ncbi:MAG: hypothetical protein JWN33_528 [Candidatus Saccharibacteria bacterium]|nr:hypothetical protein [Candidatus Saccharibacteria bacterium]
MNRKEVSDEVSKRLNQQIRQAKYGKRYYISLFLLFFAIPLYVLLQFFYVYADGWSLFDLIFVFVLLAISIHGLYSELRSKTKLPIWFTVLGVITGIVVAIVLAFIFRY